MARWALAGPRVGSFSRDVYVENYLRVWMVYDLSGLVVLEAARGVPDHQLNFWDAQIWVAARRNQLPVVEQLHNFVRVMKLLGSGP